MGRAGDMIAIAIVAILAAVALSLLAALPAMLLWNWCLVPAVPGLNEVGWLQTWGIIMLSNVLFKTSVNLRSDK